jgi:hypothetical protein
MRKPERRGREEAADVQSGSEPWTSSTGHINTTQSLQKGRLSTIKCPIRLHHVKIGDIKGVL